MGEKTFGPEYPDAAVSLNNLSLQIKNGKKQIIHLQNDNRHHHFGDGVIMEFVIELCPVWI